MADGRDIVLMSFLMNKKRGKSPGQKVFIKNAKGEEYTLIDLKTSPEWSNNIPNSFCEWEYDALGRWYPQRITCHAELWDEKQITLDCSYQDCLNLVSTLSMAAKKEAKING